MSVFKKRGSWWVSFYHDHKRHRKPCPVQSKAGAEQFEAVLRGRLMRGEPIDAPAPEKKSERLTFAEFVKEWHEIYVKGNNKPAEVYHKAIVLRVHLVPFFGKLGLDQITSEHVERYKALKRAAKLSAKTVNLHLGTLAKCLRTAIDWGRIKEMPKIAKLKAEPKPVTFLMPSESERLLAYAREREPAWHDIILLALRTGLRRGELLGLQWGDIDLEAHRLTVRRSIVMGVIGTPKNGRFRYVPMTREVYEMLASRTDRKGFVFQSVTGGANTYSTLDRNLRRVCKGAELPHVNWHTFRHTFASQLVTSGLPLNVVQQLLGHSDIKTTMVYSHFSPNLYDRAVDVLDSLGKGEKDNSGHQLGTSRNDSLPQLAAPNQEYRLNRQQKHAIA